MSFVLSVASLKGGVGKTTVTLNLASCLHRAGHRVLVVDTDVQGTCSKWAARAAEDELDGPPVVSMTWRSLSRDLEKVSKGFEVVIIDTPPRLAKESRAAMAMSDLVVMPVTPGGPDTWALSETIDAFEEVRAVRPELEAVIVLNRADYTTLARTAANALEGLEVPMLETTLGSRVAFGEATLRGMGVVDHAPSSKAADEAEALTREVLSVARG